MRGSSVNHTRLTEARLEKLSNIGNSKDLFVRDSDLKGFGVRVSPLNFKSFIVEATTNGKFTRKVLGQYPLITLAEARKRALEALRELRCGKTPLETEKSRILLLETVVLSFLADKKLTLRPSTIKDYQMVLRGDYFASWTCEPIRSITRQAVLSRYALLAKKHGPGMANKAYRVLSAAINYGRAVYPSLDGWANPISVLGETRAKVTLCSRTSHIPLESLGRWLRALDGFRDEPLSQLEMDRRRDIWLLLNLILMTGLRSNEARSLRWDDVNLKSSSVTVRKEIAKNHREAILPLNSWLVGELQARSAGTKGPIFVATCAEGYLNNLRRPVRELAVRSGLMVTPHDLRRSFATYLDRLKVPFGAIKQLLNHVSSSDITARYIQIRDVDELRPYSEMLYEFISTARTEATDGDVDMSASNTPHGLV